MSNLDRQDSIWDYFQNKAPQHFQGSVSRLNYLLKPMKRGAKVLNIGVGTGLFEKLALEKGIDIYAMDPIPQSIDTLKTDLKLGDKAQIGYGENIPFADAMFNEVVASEVLEHLSDESIFATISEIRRILEPGGFFSGSVPAREDLDSQMVVCPGCSLLFHRWGHQQSFTVARMRDILSTQFQTVTVKEEFFVPFSILNYKGKTVGLFKLLFFRLGFKNSDSKIVFRVKKT